VRFFTPFCLMRFLGVWQIARAFQRFFVEHVGRIICSAVPVCVCVCVCVFGGPWLCFMAGGFCGCLAAVPGCILSVAFPDAASRFPTRPGEELTKS